MRATQDDEERSSLDARQSSYKILVNAFYGNLGFGHAAFNDFGEADRVAHVGQNLLRQIIALVRADGGRVIEVDTDGVLFEPPSGVEGETAERAYVDTLSERMPQGINVGFDGRFARMLSYKKKNYVLMSHDGSLKYKGSSLVSRSSERFGRDFLREAVPLLLAEDIGGLHALYLAYRDRIQNREWTDASAFSKTETLKESLATYDALIAQGKRARAASYELARVRAEHDRTRPPPRRPHQLLRRRIGRPSLGPRIRPPGRRVGRRRARREHRLLSAPPGRVRAQVRAVFLRDALQTRLLARRPVWLLA